MEIIIGAAVSLLVQWFKNYAKLDQWTTLAAVLLLSVSAAAVYSVLVGLNMWQPVYTVLTTAGAFYTFIIQRFE
jgi:hypothetical protein